MSMRYILPLVLFFVLVVYIDSHDFPSVERLVEKVLHSME